MPHTAVSFFVLFFALYFFFFFFSLYFLVPTVAIVGGLTVGRNRSRRKQSDRGPGVLRVVFIHPRVSGRGAESAVQLETKGARRVGTPR